MLMKKHSNYLPTLVNDFWGEDLFPGREQNWSLNPAVNIIEGDNDFKVEVAAPGINKEDFRVNVEKSVLEVAVATKAENEVKDGQYIRKEFNYSEFRRTFSLPASVDADKIKASHKNGVLTIEVPKKEEAVIKPKQIKIS